MRDFASVKRDYPNAEKFVLPVLNRNLLAVLPLVGKISSDWFVGRAPGTLLLIGPQLEKGEAVAAMEFWYRPEGWNTAWSPVDGRYVAVIRSTDGRPPYESADFGAVIKAPDLVHA